MKRLEGGLRALGKNFTPPPKKSPVYEVIHAEGNVLVRVPKESGFMVRKSAITLGAGKEIPEHWANGKPLKGGSFLNCFYYGVPSTKIGKKIVGCVEVIKKITPDGRQFTMLNIRATPGAIPERELKLSDANGNGIRILGTDQEIEFRPRS